MKITVNRERLEALFDELDDAALLAARPAAQAAAQVLYEEALRNVDRLGRVTGNLARSVYQVYSVNNSGEGRATYHVSWNTRKAPHGHLVEFGYQQRYAVNLGKDGKWYTVVRPEMRGKPRPGRRAPQSVKDAYYVKLEQPRQIPARSFIRAAAVKLPQALDAAEREFLRRIA
jgi:hypothetical protein